MSIRGHLHGHVHQDMEQLHEQLEALGLSVTQLCGEGAEECHTHALIFHGPDGTWVRSQLGNFLDHQEIDASGVLEVLAETGRPHELAIQVIEVTGGFDALKIEVKIPADEIFLDCWAR